MPKLTEGQTIWFASRRMYGDRSWGIQPQIVTKVGRKWANFEPEGRHGGHTNRVDMTTMQVDGGGFTSPGKCYLAREDFASEQRAQAAWKLLQRHVGAYNVPFGITEDAVIRAADLLGLTISPSTLGYGEELVDA